MKSQMMTLFKELQQAQSKLDEAEGMKKNLQDRLAQTVTSFKSFRPAAKKDKTVISVPVNIHR